MAYCYVIYRVAATPVIYSMNPPVAFEGASVEYWFDPKSMQSYNTPVLETDVLPFNDIRLGKTSIDFEGTVTASTKFSTW